jgi:hypothetical protein
VDRFGQTSPEVPAHLIYGRNNPIDLLVLRVLIRKARDIYSATGVRVPVPVESESVMQALAQALFEGRDPLQPELPLGIEEAGTVRALHEEWDRAAALERESRSRFAQHGIRPDEVATEIEASDAVLGDPEAVRKFLLDAAQRLQFTIERRNGYCRLDPARLPDGLKERLNWKKPRPIVFESPPPKGLEDAEVVDRNHPLIEAISERIISQAFSPQPGHDESKFSRCGAAYTQAIQRRTALLLLRIRYRLTGGKGPDMFAEEVVTAGFRGTTNGPEWLPANSDEVLGLLQASTVGSPSQQERIEQIAWALGVVGKASDGLEKVAQARAKEIETSHERLRQQAGGRNIRALPYQPDILGVYVLVPGGRR